MTTTWTKSTKSSNPTWGKVSKNTSSWAKSSKSTTGNSFLLLENGFYILLETGSKIILEQSTPGSISWNKLTKS